MKTELNQLLHKAVELLSRYSNALVPLLFLNLIVTVPCIIVAARLPNQDPLRWLLGFFAATVIGYTIRAYDYFMKKDPDRLHSEKHQLKMKELTLVESKSGQVITDASILLSTEPPAISDRSREKELE